MKWHIRGDQHWNQMGFAIATAFLDASQLPADIDVCFACIDCGAQTAQVLFEVTILFWTVTLVAHKEESS